jgi:hypothetical protein
MTGRRWTSFTLVFAIFLANACCLNAARASRAAKPQAAVASGDAHACCKAPGTPAEKPKHPSPSPTSERCPCCDNVSAILVQPAKDVKPALDLTPHAWFVFAPMHGIACDALCPLASPVPIDTSPPLQDSPTLLRLHCASNT